MLEHIDFIKNVALFSDYSQAPGTDFDELTLVFGENGVGKTTVAAILDSLRERNAVTVTRRRSLPGHSVPTCCVTVSGVAYTFDGTDWDVELPHGTLDVFFPDFVSRNVHTGGEVATDHRRNLCEFVLGRQAVADVAKLAEADHEARAALSDIKQLDEKMRLLVKPPDTLETFVALTEDANIDERIAKANAALAEAVAAEKILARAVPTPVAFAAPDREAIAEVLALTDATIGADVATVVRSRAAVLGERGERWLDYGSQKIVGNECPFCGQDVEGVALVDAIRQYFGDAYRALDAAVRQGVATARTASSAGVINGVLASMRSQLAVAVPWSEQYLIDAGSVEQHLDAADTAWSKGSAEVEALLVEKELSPLDPIASEPLETAFAHFEAALAHVDAVNTVLTACATAAEAHKKLVASANQDQLELDVNRLMNQKMRYSDTVKDLLSERTIHVKRRADAQLQKEQLKASIDAHAGAVVGKYEAGINHYLSHFGCDIQISTVEARYPSGTASVNYKLTVRGHDIPLGAATDDPCFDSVLSEGDKYSLALAFFLARLKDIPDLTGRILVLDDPVNSLGGSRRRLVEGVIKDLRKRGAQVIVLTHDERLAAMLWRDSEKIGAMKKIVPLQVERTNSGSRLVPWDIEVATRSEYVDDYLTLVAFLDGDVVHTVAAGCIRPYVEQRLRHLYPGPPFESRETLGQMLAKIRASQPGDGIYALQPKLAELDAICDAGLPAAHATDDVAGMDPLSAEEVRIFAKKALDVLP